MSAHTSKAWTHDQDLALLACAATCGGSLAVLCTQFEAATQRTLSRCSADTRLQSLGLTGTSVSKLMNDPAARARLANRLSAPASPAPQVIAPPAPACTEPLHVPTVVEAAHEVADPADPELDAQEEEEIDDRLEFKLRTQLRDHEAAKKRLLKDLEDREQQIDLLRELRQQKPMPPITAAHKVGGTQRTGCPMIILSDWHVEEPVSPDKVNGLNKYDLDIADTCIKAIPDAFEWLLADARYDCRTGVIALIGDLLSGYIHEELVEGNFLSPVQAILWLQERIEKMLRRIAAITKLERIIVKCVDGNHGRNTNKTRVSTRTANSLEWLLFQTLAARMADDPRFEFQVAEGEWLFFDVFKTSVALTHGDTFKYQGGVGGISIPLRRGINEMRKYRKIDVTCMGHFHQRSDFGDIVVNGSMIGVSPYSMHIHAPPEPRQQTWFMIDSEKGKCLSAPVWLPQYEGARS